MKFNIRRFADQIVGVFIIFSFVAIAFVIVLLGKSQRWFTKDIEFYTVLPSAVGLSKNMAVQYKGFDIGSVKKFSLTDDDNVKVIFAIHQEFRDRVNEGAMVELQVSPIGLGNQFLFYAGKGKELKEGDPIPLFDLALAKDYLDQGLVAEIKQDDGIGALLGKLNSILGNLDVALGDVGDGTNGTKIDNIIGSLNKTLEGLEAVPNSLDNTINDIRLQLKPIFANLNALTGELNDPDGLIYTMLDTDKDFYPGLIGILGSLTSLLNDLDKTIAFLPSQLPQVARLLIDLRGTLQTADDALTAIANNPLLKGGVPNRADSQDSDISPRGIRF